MKTTAVCILAICLSSVSAFSVTPLVPATTKSTSELAFWRRLLGDATATEVEEETAAETTSKIVDMPQTAESMMMEEEEEEEELSEAQKMMQQVKDAGIAGAISYAAWEWAFWAVSVPVCVVGYRQVTGHWPDLQDADDQKKLGAEAFAFVNFARFAVPLRIGLALSTTPWIQENVVDRFVKKDEGESED